MKNRLLHTIYKRTNLFFNILKSPYFFSPQEFLWNYRAYKNMQFPEVKIVSRDDCWLKLEICNFQFFWPVEYDISGLPWLYYEVFASPERNPAAYEFGAVKIKSKSWIIDGGAGEGFFTAYALAKGAYVLVVEPVRLLCDALYLTFKNEVRLGRVRILHGCLGKSNSLTKINVDPKSVYASVTGTHSGEPVRMYTVDSIISEGIIPNAAFIKMDIEGAEIDVLKGSTRILEKFKPDLTIAVYHQLYNAKLAKHIIRKARSDYKIEFRGIYNWDGCIPRPHMLLAY